MDNTLYEILETHRHASADDIKRSYKKLCVKHHPDKGGNEDHFKRITEAYNILKDADKRRMYDQHGLDGVRGAAGSAQESDMMHAMMNDLFGRHPSNNPFGSFFGQQPQQKHSSLVKSIRIPLQDVVTGNSNLRYPHSRKVLRANSTLIKCEVCKGKGSRAMHSQMAFMQVMQEVECPQCRGRCFKNLEECYETVHEVIRLDIPKDCQEGDRIIIKRKLDEHPSHPTGDLVLQVEFEEHPVFKRVRGSHHLYMHIEISLYESLFGFRRSITYLDGTPIHVRCQKNLHSTRYIPYITGKGLFDKKTNTRRHLFILTIICNSEFDDDRLSKERFIPYILEESLKDDCVHDETNTELSYYRISDEAFIEGIAYRQASPQEHQGARHQCAQQ